MAQEKIRSKYPPIHGIGTLIKEGEMALVHINRREFLKTYAEQDQVRVLKLNHNRAIRRLGGNPKKDLNMKGIPL